MFDFRYHALSLAAVFIALIVGLLLGVAIGDKELVSSARQDLRNSLRSDVREADRERDDAKARLKDEQQFGNAAYPILTTRQLRGRRIGLVMLGGDDGAPDIIRSALEPTGADLALVAVVRENVELEALAARAEGTRYARVQSDPSLLDDLGRRAGIQIVIGGKLIGELRTALLQSLSGAFGDLDGVIVLRSSTSSPTRRPPTGAASCRTGSPAGSSRPASRSSASSAARTIPRT